MRKLILYILVMLIMICPSLSILYESNVVSYWQLDESSGLAQDSIGVNDFITSAGTISYQRTPLANNSGANDYSIHFANTSYFRGDDWNNTEGNTQFAISFWYNTTHNTSLVGKCQAGGCNNAPFNFISGAFESVTRVGGNCNYGTSNLPSDGKVHHVSATYNGSSCILYLDSVMVKLLNFSGTQNSNVAKFDIGSTYAEVQVGSKTIDNVIIWNTSLTSADVLNIFNNGVGGDFNMSIKAYSDMNNTIIQIFNATVNGSLYTTTTGVIVTNVSQSSTELYDITITSEDYFTKHFENYNPSANVITTLNKFYKIDFLGFSGNVSNSSNFVRTLGYQINITCPDFTNSSLIRDINFTLNQTTYLNCNNQSAIYDLEYISGSEGDYNITLDFATDYKVTEYNQTIFNNNFFSDLNPPFVQLLNFTIFSTFGANPRETITEIICNDTISPNLFYNLSFNNENLINDYYARGTSLTNSTNATTGLNNLTITCRDHLSGINESIVKTVYNTQVILIDEELNAPFNLDNATSVKVFLDSNRTFYDFKGNGTTSINFSTADETKLRFELRYKDNIVVQRYIDVALLDESIRVCARQEGVPDYEQLMYSAVEKEALLKNTFSDCYVAADYTRFAYQDSKVLRAYTIDMLYNLQTVDDGIDLYLASVDGSIASTINLDFLEFQSEGIDFSMGSDALTFNKVDDTEVMKIYYKNINNDNLNIDVFINRMDTNSLVYSNSEFANPNEFTLFFDYSTLFNVTNRTIFKMDINRTTAAGQKNTRRYFNTGAKSFIYSSGFAIIMALLLTIFGLTFTIARITFSWFGIFIELGSIAILSFAISAWYINFFIAINLIIIVYMVLVMINKTYPSVT